MATTKKKKKLPKAVHKTKKAQSYKAAIKNARPKHRKVMLHPVTIMVLLCVGVLIINFTRSSNADTLVVNATVPAPALTTGAIITSPANNSTITNSPIEVTGSCPNNSYVKLTNNGVFAGSAACVSLRFNIEESLSIGDNDLLAQDYNITDQAGPVSQTVSVFYTPITSVLLSPTQVATLQNNPSAVAIGTSGPNAESAAGGSSSLPLLLTANYSFKTFLTSSNFTWQVNLSGGSTPYIVIVDWDDGTTTTYKLSGGSLFAISHHYASHGYYPVIIHAIDTKGRQAYLQLAALIHDKIGVGFTGVINKQTPPPSASGIIAKIHNDIWIIWPTYAFVVLLVFSFWLGERQEYMNLMKPRRVVHKHR